MVKEIGTILSNYGISGELNEIEREQLKSLMIRIVENRAKTVYVRNLDDSICEIELEDDVLLEKLVKLILEGEKGRIEELGLKTNKRVLMYKSDYKLVEIGGKTEKVYTGRVYDKFVAKDKYKEAVGKWLLNTDKPEIFYLAIYGQLFNKHHYGVVELGREIVEDLGNMKNKANMIGASDDEVLSSLMKKHIMDIESNQENLEILQRYFNTNIIDERLIGTDILYYMNEGMSLNQAVRRASFDVKEFDLISKDISCHYSYKITKDLERVIYYYIGGDIHESSYS